MVLAFVTMAEKGGSANEQEPLIDLSSLADALPGDKTSAHSGLVNALKDKLQTLVGTSSGYIESLPPKIKKRVEILQKMQAEHDELVSKFLEEKAALEAKYQNMYEPLYSKRHDVVNGITDIEDTKEEKTAKDSKEENSGEKGVPKFWSTAMTNNEILRVQITERDEDALKFLKDIKWSRLDEGKGFKLDFFFNENPYFKNTVLTKTYYMVDENEPILERVTGTVIDWFPGKKLTEKVMRKKLKKGAKSGKTVTRVEQCASFFNFFKPPQIPDDDEDLDDDLADDLQDLLEQDYDIGSTIRDKIIPRAVSWYTGEAVETDDEDEDEEDDEEDEDGDDDEDEDEDDEDEEDDEEDDHEDKDHGHLKRFKAKPKISIHRASNQA